MALYHQAHTASPLRGAGGKVGSAWERGRSGWWGGCSFRGFMMRLPTSFSSAPLMGDCTGQRVGSRGWWSSPDLSLYKLGSGAVGRVVETGVCSQPAHTCFSQGWCLLWSGFQARGLLFLQEVQAETHLDGNSPGLIVGWGGEAGDRRQALERTEGSSCQGFPARKFQPEVSET